MKKTTLISILLVSSIANVNAADWKGQGEAGLVKSSGNTDSQSANAGLKFSKEGELWKHEFAAKYLKNSSDNVTSANSLNLDFTTKRSLSERSFLFGNLSYLDDDFDGFTEQTSISAGYGYKVIDAEPTLWEVGAGIGYRDTDQLIKLDDGSEVVGKDLSGATFVLRSDYKTKLTDNTEFVDNFKAEFSSDNTFVENDAAIVVAMNEKFALKAGVLIRHNSDPAPGADDTDTISTINLVYNFGQ